MELEYKTDGLLEETLMNSQDRHEKNTARVSEPLLTNKESAASLLVEASNFEYWIIKSAADAYASPPLSNALFLKNEQKEI
jgi:hypothetical protein